MSLRDPERPQPLQVSQAAIQHQDGTVFTVPRPGRHGNVFQLMLAERGLGAYKGSIQGFVTNLGQFVTRKEAAQIAFREKQYKPEQMPDEPQQTLMTEDLW